MEVVPHLHIIFVHAIEEWIFEAYWKSEAQQNVEMKT